MKLPPLRLRMWHLLGLVAAAGAYFAVMQYRQSVFDPMSVEVRRLRAFDPATRIAAARRLWGMGRRADSAIPSLLAALNDGDPRVRAQVAAAAAGLVAPPRKKANHPREGDVRSALIAALADPDPGARHATAVALGMLRPDPRVAIPALVEAAGDADPRVRAQAVHQLGDFEDEAACLAVASAAVRDADPHVRNQALWVLRWRPCGRRLVAFRAVISPLLKDRDAIVRGNAVELLGSCARRASAEAPELFDALADPDPYVRRLACIDLPDRPGPRTTVPALVRALGDPDSEVRAAAARRLGQIGLDAEAALPDLRRAAEDRENAVRGAASEAVRTIEAKRNDFRDKVLPGALEDLASPDADVRRGAAEILGSFGTNSAPALPALEALARDPDERVRRAAESATTAIKAGEQGPCTLEVTLPRTSFKPGEPIWLTVTFKDTSEKPVTIYLANFWPNHWVVVKDGRDREPELTDVGRQMRRLFDWGRRNRDKNVPHVLKEGESWETGKDVDVTKLYRLVPGRYKVAVTYDDPQPPTPLRVTSKPVEFEVE